MYVPASYPLFAPVIHIKLLCVVRVLLLAVVKKIVAVPASGYGKEIVPS